MGAFYLVHDINTITTGSATVSSVVSERPGYEFTNAYSYPYRPDLKWRSRHPPSSTHALSITPSGNFDTVVILGANINRFGTFSPAVICTCTKHYDGAYRGFYQYSSAQSGAKTFAVQSTVYAAVPYMTLWAIIAGTRTSLGVNPGLPSLKRIAEPQKRVVLAGGSTRQQARGTHYHGEMRWSRRGLSYAEAASLRDLKKDLGRTEPFIIYENQDDQTDIYLVRRLDDFGVIEDEDYFEDEMRLREIA